MVDMELLSLVGDLRARGEEILLRAMTMHNAYTRQKLHEIAAQYERLAQRVEQEVGGAAKLAIQAGAL
jgi:hypothetical protein